MLLILKDVAAVAIIVALLPGARGRFRWAAPDLLAAAYVAVIGAYAVIPRLFGDAVPLSAVLTSFRELMLPVELYAMGRLAAANGVNTELLVRIVIGAGVVAAAFALVTIALVPPTFWATTLDMVALIRDVQGVPGARTLRDLSIVASYGQDAEFVRAIGPFTHPVGAASYFNLALALSLALVSAGARLDGRARLFLLGGAVVLGLAIVATISRASWIAAAIATVIVAAARGGRWRLAVGAVLVVAAIVVLVPPYSHAVWSVSAGTDSSTVGHARTTIEGIRLLLEHPLGLGVGYWDYIGASYGSESAPAENLFIAVAVAGGPLAVGLFAAWFITLLVTLRRDRSWIALGVMAAGTGYFITAFINSPLLRFTTAASFWLLLGLVASTRLATVARERQAAASPAVAT